MTKESDDWLITKRWYKNRGCEWTHRYTGEVIQHCCHPTALRPYWIINRMEELGTFRLLEQAKAAALAANAKEKAA